jgi:hypothetical protein
MNKPSPLNRRLSLVAICVLAFSGFGFLYSGVTGNAYGLRAWLLPFGPWFCALLAYRLANRHPKNENNPG